MADRQDSNPFVGFEPKKEETGKCRVPFAVTALIITIVLFFLAVGLGIGLNSTKTKETDSPSPDDIRLPTTLIPDTYDVRLRPDLTGTDPTAFRFNGSVRIQFNVSMETDVITLHAKSLTIDVLSISVLSAETHVVKVKKTSADVRREFFHVHLADLLRKNNPASIYLRFSGPIKPDLAGIYYSSYFDADGTKKYFLTSHLHPTESRKVFPCFDEPQLKAKFNVILERRNDATTRSLSNTKISSLEEMPGGWMADHYMQTPPMSTYLLAFIVSEFNCSDTTSRGKQAQSSAIIF